MSARVRVWLGIAALLGFLAAVFARERADKSHGFRPVASAGLDAMQLEAAGRVALESAADAMERGDLERLRMLSRWVRERAQVVLFQPNDLTSLDLAIGCLDHSVPRPQAVASLAKLTSGKLRLQAQTLCSEQTD